jgi:rubrerythrin
MTKPKNSWRCPKCGNTVGSDIDPQYMKKPPVCNDFVKHHSRKQFEMELINE